MNTCQSSISKHVQVSVYVTSLTYSEQVTVHVNHLLAYFQSHTILLQHVLDDSGGGRTCTCVGVSPTC